MSNPRHGQFALLPDHHPHTPHPTPQGIDACFSQEGVWVLCPPLPRTTLNGQTCRVPFRMGATQRTDCVVPATEAPAIAGGDTPPTTTPGGSAEEGVDGSATGTSGGDAGGDGGGGGGGGRRRRGGAMHEVCALDDGSLDTCLPTYVPPPTLQPR